MINYFIYNMKLQKSPYSCGAAAIVNVLRCFGIKIAENRIRKIAKTNEIEGTTKEGIITALKEYKIKAKIIEVNNEENAWKEIIYSIEVGHPAIICISNMQHWVSIVGKLGNRFIVFDPSNYKNNKNENGVKVLYKTELLKKWKSRRGIYLGIICGK